MKKLGLTFAAIGLFFATTAQAQEEAQNMPEVATEIAVGDEFEKIEVAELPEAVATAVSTDYAEASTTEAWVKEKDDKQVYKIKLDVNGEEKVVYVDAEGNWLEKEDTQIDE